MCAFQQLLDNLISNALKYHHPGIPPQVSISYQRLTSENSPDVHQLTIADQGWAYMGAKPANTVVACLNVDDIRAFPPSDYAGIIVLRPAVQTVKNIQRLVRQVIALLPTEPLAGHLWIVDEGQIRIRGGPPGTP